MVMEDNLDPKRSVSAFDSETFQEDTSIHLDQPVGSMSISPCGRDVVLASKEGLHIIDLDSPYSPPRHLPHHTSWEVADVQWSPFAVRDFWVVSTSNQKALVWNLGMGSWQEPIEFVLHGHSRAITDINFSAHHPDVLATCAVDSFVHCWDLRLPVRPVISFSDWFAGATQVKWSRQDSHVVASSHDRYLRIWDDRMGAYPVRSIEAHDTKIYGVDWNRFEPNKLVTCSLDRTIKFWNCNNLEDVPERVINAPFPVWRARHTPFGWGMLAMPQRGNSDLHLYDRRTEGNEPMSGPIQPVADFPGHKGQVKEFLWRARGQITDGIDHRDFQLVSWGTDRELRLHRIVPETLVAVGYEKGVSETKRLIYTRRGARYKTFRDEPLEPKFNDVFDSQAGSSPARGHSFQLRPRGSTSVGMSKMTIPHSKGWVQGTAASSRIGMHGKVEARQDMTPIAWMKNVKIASWDQDSLAEEITGVGEMFAKVDFDAVDVQRRKATISMNGPWGVENAPLYMRVDMYFPKGYPQDSSVLFKVQKTASMTDALLKSLSTELRTIAETYASKKRGCLEAVLRYLLREQNMEQIVTWVLEESLEGSITVDDVGLGGDSSSDEEDDRAGGFQGAPGLLHASDVLNTNVLVPVAKACGALWSDCGKLVCFFPPKQKESPVFLDSLGMRDPDQARTDRVFEGFGRLQTESPGPRTTAGRTVTTGDEAASDLSDDELSSSSSSSASSDIMTSLPTGFVPHRSWRGGVLGLRRSRSTDYSNKSASGFGNVRSTIGPPSNIVSIHSFDNLIPSKSELALEYKVFGNGPEVCDHNSKVAARLGNGTAAQVWKLVKLILHNEVPLQCISGLKAGCDVITIAQPALGSLKRKDSGIDLSHDAAVVTHKIATKGRIRWGESPFGNRYLVSALFEHYERLADVQMLAMLSCVLAEPRAADPDAALLPQNPHDLSMQLKSPAFSVDYYPSMEVADSLINQAPTSSFATANSKLAAASAGASEHSSYPSNSTDVNEESERTNSQTMGSTPLSQQFPSHRRSSRPSVFENRDHRDRESGSLNSTAISFSTSPEETRMSHRSNSNLAFSFSRASLTALAQSYSNSPPTQSTGNNNLSGSAKPSPAGSFGTNGWSTSNAHPNSRGTRNDQSTSGRANDEFRRASFAPAATFMSSRLNPGEGGVAAETSRNSSRPLSRSSTPQKSPTSLQSGRGRRKIRIRSALHNQNEFDNDGYASVPLLDPSLEWKYKAYRASYAHLLGGWELYAQMAEILKFDGLISYFAIPDPLAKSEQHKQDEDFLWNNATRRKTFTNISKAELVEKRGLELRRRCRECGNALAAVEKNGVPIGWHCASASCPAATTKTSTRSLCVVCEKVVGGLMLPCLECGHMTCFACAKGWFGSSAKTAPAAGASSDTEDEEEEDDDSFRDEAKTCPSGCGCPCPTLDRISVPYPPEPEPEPEQEKPVFPRRSHLRQRSERLMSEHGPDTAIGAFLSLTRTRSISAAKESMLRNKSVDDSAAIDDDSSGGESDHELDPWAGSKYATLGRGLGAGLSRGLSSKSSEITVRRSGGK